MCQNLLCKTVFTNIVMNIKPESKETCMFCFGQNYQDTHLVKTIVLCRYFGNWVFFCHLLFSCQSQQLSVLLGSIIKIFCSLI